MRLLRTLLKPFLGFGCLLVLLSFIMVLLGMEKDETTERGEK